MEQGTTQCIGDWSPSDQRHAAQAILLWQRIERGGCCAPRCAKNAPKRLVCGAADCRHWLRNLDPELAIDADQLLAEHLAGVLIPAPQVTYRPLIMAYL